MIKKSNKKYIALAVSAIITFSILSVLNVELVCGSVFDEKPIYEVLEPALDAYELAQNGSFEIGTNPSGWLSSHTWGSNYTSVQTGIAHTGNRSVKISSFNADKTWIRQAVPVMPNTQYQVSIWINSISFNSVYGLAYKYEFYNSSNFTSANSVGVEGVSQKYAYISNGEWVRYVQTVTTPENAAYMLVYPRMFAGEGTVYVDDFSVYRISEIPIFSLNTDEIFYYSDWAGGTATAKINLNLFSEYANGYFKFRLKDGAAVITEAECTINNSTSTFDFDVSALEEIGKEYTVECAIADTGGTELQTYSTPVYRYDRPAALTADGVYLKNGKPFTPVIGYHVNKSQYGICKNYGINVVQLTTQTDTSALLTLLDKADAAGLMAMVCLYIKGKAAGDPTLIENTRAMVAAAKDHPATFAYAVLDEPSGYLSDFDVLRISYKEIRDIDPVHPVYMVEPNQTAFEIIGKCADILATDPYPGAFEESGRRSVTYVGDMIGSALDAVKNRKPVYGILQAFDYKGLQPTGEHIRHFLWQTFLTGAKGAGYYAMDEQRDGSSILNTELWAGISGFSEKEYAIAADHLVYHHGTLLSEYKDGSLWYRIWKNGQKIYAILLDHSETERDVTISILNTDRLKSINNYTASSISYGGGAGTSGSGGVFYHHMTPHQAVLYEIKPINAVDISIRDQANNVIASFNRGDTLKVNYKVNEPVCNAMLTVTVYKNIGNNKMLLDVQVEYLDTSGNEISLPVATPANEGTYSVEVFCWGNFNSLDPILNKITAQSKS